MKSSSLPYFIGAALAVFTFETSALDLGKLGVKKGKEGGTTFDFASPPAAQSSEFIHITSGNSLKDIKKVAIVNFLVEFTTVKKAHVISRRPGASSESTSTFTLGEADNSRYQSMTDSLYDQLVADLTAAGIEVIPHETLKAEKRYQDFKKVQHDSPWATSTKDGRSVFIGAKGMPVYLDNPERASKLNAAGMSLGMMFGQNPTLLEVKLSSDLKANLLSVNMVVDFADLKTKKGFGNTSIETSYDQYLHGDDTRYRFTGIANPNGPALRLKHGMLAEHSPFMNFKEGKWTWQMASGELGKEDGGFKKSTSYDFSPETYYINSDQLLKAAHGMFINEICKARGATPSASAANPVPQPK